MAPSQKIAPPRVAQSPVSFECKLDSIKTLYNDSEIPTAGIVFGRIVNVVGWEHALVRKNADGTGPIVGDLNVIKVVSRLGGVTYGRTTQGYDIPRP
jgi:flavin reductase (DIM6/NTAB) family NADH-FMN oxidoreductase RutF